MFAKEQQRNKLGPKECEVTNFSSKQTKIRLCKLQKGYDLNSSCFIFFSKLRWFIYCGLF